MTTLDPARTLHGLTALRAPRLRRDQLWIPAGVLLAAVIVLAGWSLLISPQRAQTATMRSQVASVDARVDQLTRQLAVYAEQNKDLASYQAALATAQAALPTTSSLPAFLRSLQDTGAATGVAVTSMSATTPTAVTAAASNGIPAGVYQLTISVTAKGDPAALTRFVQQLQTTQARAVLITSSTEQADRTGTTLVLNLTAFMAPGSTGTTVTGK